MKPAATITVTSTADSGAGALRPALADATDGDSIDAAGLSGTILLTSGQFVLSAETIHYGFSNRINQRNHYENT
jgi:hypothetical protein